MTPRNSLLALCAAAALCGPAAASAVATYSYSGVVDADEAGRGWVGFTGQFSFGNAVVDQLADPQLGYYPMGNAPFGMSAVFDGSTAVSFSQVLEVMIVDDFTGIDLFSVYSRNDNAFDALALVLTDPSHALFASDALLLPAGGLTLAMFGGSKFSYDSGSGLLTGHLTSLSCSAGCEAVAPSPTVPEPATWALALGGLLAMGSVSRRRNERQAMSPSMN